MAYLFSKLCNRMEFHCSKYSQMIRAPRLVLYAPQAAAVPGVRCQRYQKDQRKCQHRR
jgi:hypothetical protein